MSALLFAVALTNCSGAGSSKLPLSTGGISALPQSKNTHVPLFSEMSSIQLQKLKPHPPADLLLGSAPGPDAPGISDNPRIANPAPADFAMSALFARQRPNGLPRGLSAAIPGTSRTAQNYVYNNDDGGQTGIDIPYPAGEDGMYAGHSGYYASEAFYGQSSTGGDVLYAPTSRPNNSCLEVGTGYYPPDTNPRVYAYDFCDPNATPAQQPGIFHVLAYITPGFRASYERNYGDGVPQYTMEIKRNSNYTWTAYLYNFSTSSYQAFYTSGSTYSPYFNTYSQQSRGWSLFETHYPGNNVCMRMPTIEAGGMQMRLSGRWTTMDAVPYVKNIAATYGPATSQGIGECLGSYDNSTIGSFYVVSHPSYHQWIVVSYR